MIPVKKALKSCKPLIMALLGGVIFPALSASPSWADSLYGNLYLGFRVSPEFQQMASAELSSIPFSIPIRGKLYYQDKVYRIDLLIPSFPQTSTQFRKSPSAGKQKTSTQPAFQVFTFLFSPSSSSKPIFIDNKLRRAYLLELPNEFLREMVRAITGKDIDWEELRRQAKKEGVIISKPKQIKSRKYENLTATGWEIKVTVPIPKDLRDLLKVADLSSITLRFLKEKRLKVPLSVEMESKLFTLTFGLRGISTDRLPEVLFQIPEFYIVESLNFEEFLNILKEFGRSLEAQIMQPSTLAIKVQAQPEEEVTEEKAEEKAEEAETESEGAEKGAVETSGEASEQKHGEGETPEESPKSPESPAS